MKGNAKAVFSIILFMGIVALLSASLFTVNPGGLIYTNQSNTNLTLISSDNPIVPPKCDYQGEIPVVTQFLWGLDCVAGFTGYMFSLATINSSVAWLGIVLLACAGALIYLGAGLLRGGK